MQNIDDCDLLEWDSAFFARRIARVRSETMTPALLDSIALQAQRDKLDCVYFLADPHHSSGIALAESNDFRLVDVRLTLDAQTPNAGHPAVAPALRSATPSDAKTLRAMARINHTDSRFYHDGSFSRERCDALYEEWIDKSLDGWADAVLIAEVDGQAMGYITCSRRSAQAGQIGLLGVDQSARGTGVGGRLVRGALDWFMSQGCRTATVVTQGRNVAAQRLYQKYGFRTCETRLWFHRWF